MTLKINDFPLIDLASSHKTSQKNGVLTKAYAVNSAVPLVNDCRIKIVVIVNYPVAEFVKVQSFISNSGIN